MSINQIYSISTCFECKSVIPYGAVEEVVVGIAFDKNPICKFISTIHVHRLVMFDRTHRIPFHVVNICNLFIESRRLLIKTSSRVERMIKNDQNNQV